MERAFLWSLNLYIVMNLITEGHRNLATGLFPTCHC